MPELPPPPEPTSPWRGFAAAAAALRIRWSPLTAGLGAALALVVVAAVAVGAWRANGSTPPIEMTMPRAGPSGGPGPSSPGVEVKGTAPEQERAILVHAAGAVVHPGLYRLPDGARVADVLDSAGGPAPGADLDAVNLAAKVSDGERLYVAREGEVPPPPTATAPGAGSVSPTEPLDLNTATAQQLEELPGVGPATAAAIVSFRDEHGPFRSVEDLLEVRGIGEAKLAAVRPKVRVS